MTNINSNQIDQDQFIEEDLFSESEEQFIGEDLFFESEDNIEVLLSTISDIISNKTEDFQSFLNDYTVQNKKNIQEIKEGLKREITTEITTIIITNFSQQFEQIRHRENSDLINLVKQLKFVVDQNTGKLSDINEKIDKSNEKIDKSNEKIHEVKNEVSEIKGKLSINLFVIIVTMLSVISGILSIHNKLPSPSSPPVNSSPITPSSP